MAETDTTAGAPAPVDQAVSDLEAKLTEARAAQAKENEAPYYCPGCGKRWQYLTECRGKGEAGHPPILVVSTDELDGPPEGHTPAPNTDVLAKF